MYGYSRVETPALAAFRKEAILFERAFSHVPLTLPSHGSLFTGTLPAVHGLRDNLGYRLSDKVPTIAELLKKAGYATGGAISSIVLNGASGIGRGFDLWEDAVEPSVAGQPLGRVQRSGAETVALLGGWVERQPAGQPFFAFLHLYEPHAPYEPPEPYAARYAGRAYDGEIAYADELVGRFFDLLKKKGSWDQALVAVLSDHGEGLGEHGEDEHGVFLYRYALQVPLVVKLPKGEGAGTKVAEPVQLSDLFATIASAAGLRDVAPPPGTTSLLDVASGRAEKAGAIYAETLYPRIHFGWSELHSLLDGPWQYIEAPAPELYDLAKDPAEDENLAAGSPPAFRTLRIEMEKRRAAFTAPARVDPEEARKLASLGYLSTGAAAGSGPLPDPKDEIGIVRELKRVAALFLAKRYDEAIAGFRALRERNPRMKDLSDLYSQALQHLGRTEEALGVLRQAAAASPDGATHYSLAIAELCLKLGRLEEAERHAGVARERGDAGADDVMARIYLAEKKWDAAEREAKASLAARPNRRPPYLVLARVELERNNLPAALELVDRARVPGEARAPQGVRNLHLLRGEILRRMERLIEAEAEFREEIRVSPENADAWASLAAVCEAEGRPAEADAVRRAAEGRFPSDRRFRRTR